MPYIGWKVVKSFSGWEKKVKYFLGLGELVDSGTDTFGDRHFWWRGQTLFGDRHFLGTDTGGRPLKADGIASESENF